jgi:hypothetical protein
VADLDEQFRKIRAEQLESTLQHLVWLDAAALAAVVAAARADAVLATSLQLLAGVWMFGISLAIALCVPAWRAIVNAKHQDSGVYKMHWSSYYAMLLAAALAGLAVLLVIAALTSPNTLRLPAQLRP